MDAEDMDEHSKKNKKYAIVGGVDGCGRFDHGDVSGGRDLY